MPIVKYRDFLPGQTKHKFNVPDDILCARMAKPWAEGGTSSIVFARWGREGTLAPPGEYD